MKKIFSLSILVIIVMCIVVPLASAITDYRYYTKVNITNTTAADITGRYVIDINSSAMVSNGFMQADADDARIDPELDLMYGTLTNGTGTFTGSPIKLAINNTITCTVAGTATIVLPQSTTGTVTTGTMTVTGSPVALTEGSNTITTTGAVGNFTVDVVYDTDDKASTFGELTNTSAYWYTDYITVPAYGTVSRYIWTGNTGATTRDQCWVASDADTNTVADDASLDITDNLTVSTDLYLDSLPGSEKEVVSKENTYEFCVDATDYIARIGIAGAPTTLNMIPNAAGTLTNQTPNVAPPNYQMIDDPIGAPDDAATYVYPLSVGGYLSDSYNLPTSGLGAAVVITSVDVTIRGFSAGGGAGTFQPFLLLNGSYTYGTTRNPGAVWTTYTETLSRPGGGAWSVSDIDALEVGVNSYGQSGAGVYGYTTQEYITVHYYPVTLYTAKIAASTGSWHNIEMNYDTGNVGAELRIRVDGGAWTTTAAAGGLTANAEDVYIGIIDGKMDNTIIDDNGTEVLDLEYEATQITGAAAVTTVEDQSASTNDMSSTRDGNPAGITVTLNGTLPATYSVPPVSVTSLTNDSTKEINQPDYIGTEQGNTFDDSNVPGLIVNTASDVSGIETQWIWWFIYGLICIMLLLVGFSLGGHITIGWFMVIIGTALFVAWGPIPWWFIPVDVIFMIGTLSWENRTTM